MALITAVAHPRSEWSRTWLSTLEDLERHGHTVKCEISRWAGHSRKLAAELASQSELMLVLGGDGTIHEVINGLMEVFPPGSPGRPTLVPVPLGTGNDFCRALGTRLDRELLLRTVLEPRPARLDLGRLTCLTSKQAHESFYFASTASVGFAAEVAWRTDHLPGKNRLRKLAYSAALLLSLTGHRSSRGHLTLGEEHLPLHRLFNVNLCNTRFYGGGMVACPEADPFDGYLDLVSMQLTRPQVLRNLPRNYSGDFDGVAGVDRRRFTRLRVETEGSVLVQADGQVVGTTPLEVELLAGELSVLVPPPPAPPG